MPQLTIKDSEREQQILRQRILVALAGIFLLLLLLVGRLLNLQWLDYEHYSTLSHENRVKVLPIAPIRGLIYDRKGRILAENRPSFTLAVIPEQVRELDNTLADLGQLISINDEDRQRFFRDIKRKRRFENVPLRFNLSEQEVARFAVNAHRFPGVVVEAVLSRVYPYAGLTGHLVGYVGRINVRELKHIDASNYSATRRIGKTGIERMYEDLLHGTVGYQQVEINAQGRILRVLERTPPQPGVNLYLTVDMDLQQAAAAALQGRRGAVVAIEPDSGDVLALVSTPGFDPNLFVNGISSGKYRELRDSPDRPLFNRALQGQYPPGSTIKPMMGLAGLEYGLRKPTDLTWCPGWYRLKGQEHKYRCWKKVGHGHVDIEDAIVQSCDVYFYTLAHDMGIDRMHDFLSGFGLGHMTGIDLPGERSGLWPSRAWKQRVRNLPWFPGETLITGIGQGFTLATPLQLAQAVALISRRGDGFKPRLLRRIEDPVIGETRDLRPQAALTRVHADARNWATIIKAMHHVVQGARGTARASARGAGYRYAGKTGTAQVYGIKQDEKADKNIAEHLRDHALFIAFAPLDVPRIAVAVVVENGGSGSHTAAPIARKVLDAYLGETDATPGDPHG